MRKQLPPWASERAFQSSCWLARREMMEKYSILVWSGNHDCLYEREVISDLDQRASRTQGTLRSDRSPP